MDKMRKASIDKKFDKKIDKLKRKGLLYLPWIGKNFANSKTKLLVLGESNYDVPKEEHDESWIRTLVTQNFAPKLENVKHPYKLLVGLLKALYNKKDNSEEEKLNFADNMAISNIVQRSLKNNKDRPTKDDYKKGWKIVSDLIRIIRPKNIIIIGVESINCLLSVKDETNIKIYNDKNVENKINIENKIDGVHPRKFSLKYNNETSKCIAIRHTAKYFSWKKWHKFIMKNIDLKEIIRE